MKITINCRSFLKPNFTGIGRYAYNLVQNLSEIDQDNTYVLYAAKGLFDKKRIIPKINKPNFTTKTDFLKLGAHWFLKDSDIYHLPSPDMVKNTKAKVIVTIHDLVYKAYPQGHTDETLKLTDKQFKNFLPKASRLLCTSESTAADLRKYFDVEESKIKVIYPGIDEKAFYPIDHIEKVAARKTIESKGILDPFILYVGTIEPRKNLRNLMRAFSQLKNKGEFKGKLVIAGMKGWKSESFEDDLKKLGILDDVIVLGFLSNEELRHLYGSCEVFVFPSFYEGFGFPIVEAFSCKAAVVTSNISSCPELAGDAALMIDPDGHEAMTEAIGTLLNDKVLKKSLSERGLERAKAFSFKRTAEETLKVYEEVLKE